MKYLLLLFLLIPTVVFADRVCLEKSTGKLIEYQSCNPPLGTLTQNAINAGYKQKDIIEKYVNTTEWLAIKKQWIDDPSEKIRQDKINSIKQKEIKLKQKFNWTDEDLADIKEVLTTK